jgi:transposase InsO family protein
VRETVEKYGIPAIINSDQGSQFTSKEYKELAYTPFDGHYKRMVK